MNGRIYDPLLGRMLSADTFVQAPTNLQSYNRYSYVMNNPLRFVDPTGFWTEEGLQAEMASTEAGQNLASEIGELQEKGWTFVSAENLRVDGVANPRIAGYTDKENKIVYLRRDEKLPDYKAMKTLGHESLGHAKEREKTGENNTTLNEEVGARVIGENLMIDAKRLDAVDPKSLGADGKPSPDAIKAQLSTPDMKKAYNQRVVPKDAPPPKMPVVTADKTIPILVPKPKPPIETPPPPPPEDEKKKP